MAVQVKFPFGRLVNVLVTHVDDSSGDFFVQINDEAGKLDALMAEIEQNVLSGRAKPPKASEIMVGSVYIVQYQEDSRWYRARVLAVNIAEEQCEVFFVDYGNTQLVPLSCMRNAEDRFCELAPQSFECELEGFDCFRGDRFDAMLALLNETILEQEVYCKAVQLKKNCVLVTQLFVDDKGTRSVLDEMQSGGLGDTTDTLSNGHATIPRQPNLKREVKYEVISLSPDSFHDLSVTWVEDPSHFWCQLLSNAEILEDLMENLADIYTNLEPAVLPLQSCTVGYPCCAKFYEDDAWYRGIITNVSAIATGQIEVRFVDYGNSQNTELSDVKDLKDEFLKEPRQAMYFAIAGVDPASKDGLWADEAKSLFEKLIKFKHVVGLVTSVESDGRHRVRLMDTTSDLDMELNQILIAANYGVKSTDIPTPVTTKIPSTSFKSSEPVPKSPPRPVFAQENVQVGVEEKILVTNIVTPAKFYCQMFKNGRKLENLMMEVGRHYSKLGANEELLASPSPGDPCCAQFSEDNCWYRAIVLSTDPKGVAVLYIDYGNSETVPLNKVKKLIPKFSELPQQGIECTLNRIKPTFAGGEPKWRASDNQKFKDLALEMEGKITVVAQDGSGVCRVELVVRNRKEEQNISEQLLIGGNAELADRALPASQNFANLKAQTFPEPDLEVGQFEDVIVSYTEHPCNFWCQLQKSVTQLDSLMKEISELYSVEGQRNSISGPACGMLCCAQFTEDNKWYRGKITGIKKGGLVEVHFVDYGNYEMLPLSRVKKLQAEYLTLPPQAVKCALAKIDPLNKDLLSDDVMNRFEELTLDKELVMMADKYDESSGSFEVVLLDTTEGKNLDIAKDLQTIMGLSMKRETAHIVGVEIQPGTSEWVFVSSATNPATFSCQLMKTAESLDELMNQMFEYYEQLSAQQEQMTKPSVGEFCAAKFTLDDGWYRAKVLEVQGNDVSVLYVDYGNSEVLSLSRLKALNSKFHSLPSQAIGCSLSGNFSGIPDTQFQDLVSEKEFTAKVLAVRSGVAVIDLVSKETNESIANVLSKAENQQATTSVMPSACTVANLQLKTGDAIDIYVSFVESAQKFFCQASNHSSELDDLMNSLEEHYSTGAENLSTIKVGSCCVAWYSEGGWYRAKVEQVQGREVKVHYIDYGDNATVPLSSIRTLKPEFSCLPAQAVQCCLKGFSTSQGPENFKDLVLEQEFKLQVISAKSGGIYEVDLMPQDGLVTIGQMLSKDIETPSVPTLSVPRVKWNMGEKVDVFIPFVESAQSFFCQSSQNASDLDDLMAKLEEYYSTDQEHVRSISAGAFCIAQYEDGGWYRAQVIQVQGENVKVFYIDYGDTTTLSYSSIRTLKPEFSSLPAQAVKCCLKGYATSIGPENFKDLVIEQEFNAQVMGLKEQHFFEVELVSKDGSTFISQELLEGTETTDKPFCTVANLQWKPGDKVEVFVPFVESAQKFFCQAAQSSNDLDDLMAKLEEHYSMDQEAVTSVTAGSFCVAQYEDGGWYRAQVTQVQEQSVCVFYIDYGNTATLPFGRLRTLRPEFSSLPAQAMKCCLKGHSSGTGPKNFTDLVIEQEFEAQVVDVKEQKTYEVELVSKDGSTFISKELPEGTETKPPSCSVASIQWKPGDKVEVFVPFVESAQKFFCQAVQSSNDLDDLMAKLEDHYSTDQKAVASISTGDFCVAQYEDGGWYRAHVTQVNGQSVSVFYIDYGDTANLSLSSIRIMKPEFALLPAQAVQCSLGSYGPENFKDNVLEQEFDLHVIASKEPGMHEVKLVSKDGSRLFDDELLSETKTEGATPHVEMTEGSFIQLCPTECVSPHLFYCQIATADHKENLQQMMDHLQEYYEALGEQEQGLTNPTVGMNCAAVFADDSFWYRGRILKVVDQQLVEVCYLDFGNSKTVPLKKVKTINEDLLQLPPQAIQCSIASIAPVRGAEWSDVTVERFSNLIIHKMLLGKIIRKGSDNNLEIELFDTTDSSVDLNIGELLVKEGLASFGASSSAKPSPAIKSLSEFGKLQLSENEKVYVTTVESPGCFYCQISGSEDKLASLMSEIASVYDSLPGSELVVNSISVGDVCCAQFTEDNQWYRAVVEENTANTLTVRFVDYGNVETLPISRTKVLKDVFYAEPPLAINCGLRDVQPSSGQSWSDDSGVFFEEITSEKELDAKFLSFTEPFQIQLSGDGADIGEELVKAQLAVAKSTSPGMSTSAEYAKPVVECGEMYDMCISHMFSPGKFYCQLVNMSEQLDGMMTDLNNHYFELSETEGCLDSPTVGQPCVALFEDMWYRAKILNLSRNVITVHYVDYGNEETLKDSGVKQIKPLFLKTPQAAIECSLDLKRDEWSEEATALFEDLTRENQLVIKIVTQQGDTYQVKVFDKDKRCISEDVYNTITAEVQESQKEKFALREMALHSGQTEDVYVVHAEGPQEFYVQLSKTYDQLVHMMSEIARVYSSLSDDVRPEDLVVGAPLCALFDEDGVWYRAVIESIPSEFEVGVRYIDYGNSDVVILSDVRQLRKQFFGLPVQAVRCCLNSHINTESFYQRVGDKELKAKFLSPESSMWKVSLSDKVGEIGELKLKDMKNSTQIRDFIQPEVTPETKRRVYVSHVVSPDEFYVQFECSLDELSTMSGEISKFYSKLLPSAFLLNNPCSGMSCCARFTEDGNWYRGKIKEVGSFGAQVEFVDYGNSEVVPFRDIKDADKTFMQLPQQAILCGLDATKDVWSAEEVNIFKTVALDKCVDATFIICDGLKWRVCLESNGVSIVNMFLPKDAAHHQNASEVSSVQTGTYTQQKLASGQVEEVFVSYVTESGDFFVQLSKTTQDLQTIELLISETYDHLGPYEEALEMCFVDSLCCAKFSVDFKWYRALVTKVFSDTEVEVLFVDYGNTGTLKVETVKQIKSGLSTFPVQAVKCHLEGSKEVWTENDVRKFEASIMDKPLHVTFTRQEGDTWFVTIQELDMFTSKTAPKVKAFSKEVLDCSKQENAYFVSADSPDCLWLQPERTADDLIELMNQIANDVTGQPMDQSQLMPRVPCLAQFTDNDVWHRAQIQDVQDRSNVTVFYVDYGNSETLTVDRLHPISDAHFKLPAQAICCRLADVQGVEPGKVAHYLNEVLFEKVLEVEVQDQHRDGSYTVRLYEASAQLSINELVVGECLGDTSLIEETNLELSTPPRKAAAQEERAFKLPELKMGSKVPVSFVSAFLPSEMQLLLTERITERNQITNSITAIYEAVEDGKLKLENPEVGVLCCVNFTSEQDEAKKWFRGEIVSISADDTATVKLVDYGMHEKIPISEIKCLKDELLEIPVFVLESSLANICPSSESGQWSPECSNILESLCCSEVLVAEIMEVSGDFVELILSDNSGTSVNQRLVDLGYAKTCDVQEDFSVKEQSLKWPELQVGQCVEVYMVAVKDLQSIQLQLANSEADLTNMREHLTAVYSTVGKDEEVVGNPRVGQVCCAQFAEDQEWYRAIITCVSGAGVEVKFVDFGNMDVALSIKQLKDEFFVLPVQCFECSLHGVVLASDFSETEVAANLLELYDGKQLTAEVTSVSGDSVVSNLFHKSGEAKESVADILVKMGYALYQSTTQEERRRVSVSEDGKIVYNYPQYGDFHNVRLISVSSPSDFWCQLTDSRSELKLLSEKIEQFYQSLGENDLRLLCLQVGDICCAKFTEDNKWYRSLVSEVCSDGQVCVYSVDYSKQETLTLNRIKKLEAEFVLLPVQSIKCSLSEIEPPHKYYEEEWSNEAVERFKELCKEEALKIIIKGRDEDLTYVELLDSTGLSVADQLLSEHLAVEIKSPLTVSPVKSTEKRLSCSSTAQSSEEDLFQEAESGIEGEEEVAEGKENDEEEEEFLDSNEQIVDKEKDETLSFLQGKQEEAIQATENSQERDEVNVTEKKEALESEKVDEGDEKELQQVAREVLEEKQSIETEEQQEDDGSKEQQEMAEELETEVVCREEKEEETVSEDVDGKLEEAGHVDNAAAAEGTEKAEEEGEQAPMEEGHITGFDYEGKDNGAEEETNVVESPEITREGQEESEMKEEHVISTEKSVVVDDNHSETGGKEQEKLKLEGGPATAAISEVNDDREKETNIVDSSEIVSEEQQESLVDEGRVAAIFPKENGEEAQEKTNNVDNSKIIREQQQETLMEERHVTTAVSKGNDGEAQEETNIVDSYEIASGEGGEAEEETDDVESSESAIEVQEELKVKEGFVTAAVSEEGGEAQEVESSETVREVEEKLKVEKDPVTVVQSPETAGEEQGESQMAEGPVVAVSNEKSVEAEKEASDVDNSETAGEEHENAKLEEDLVTAANSVGKVDVEKEINNVDSYETAREQPKVAESLNTAISEEICDGGIVEEQTTNADSSKAAIGEQEKPMEKESIAACVTEQKEEGAGEQSEKFADPQEVTEALSEEDLTVIAGSVNEGVEATDEYKSDEERTSVEETTTNTSADQEEAAKIFLEEILSEVCKDDDEPHVEPEHREQLDKLEEEQPTDLRNSKEASCDDVDNSVLSDEALDQLDRELENADEKQLKVACAVAMTIGTSEQESQVVENGQDDAEQSDINGCHASKSTITIGSKEVENDLALNS